MCQDFVGCDFFWFYVAEKQGKAKKTFIKRFMLWNVAKAQCLGKCQVDMESTLKNVMKPLRKLDSNGQKVQQGIWISIKIHVNTNRTFCKAISPHKDQNVFAHFSCCTPNLISQAIYDRKNQS